MAWAVRKTDGRRPCLGKKGIGGRGVVLREGDVFDESNEDRVIFFFFSLVAAKRI